MVAPKWYRLTLLLIQEGATLCHRRDGLAVPDDFTEWIADLSDMAGLASPLAEPSPPSQWVTVKQASATLGLSTRRVTDMRSRGTFRSRRVGRSWMLAGEDVAEEALARRCAE